MPECQECGSFVSADYARVFTPQKHNQPQQCPECGRIRGRETGDV